ncbi:hypothetical protein [Streptomyces bohaiensis]|uniref:Galactose oxidase n=1 Tax=Streptomyces bohaiensis TaxID=1431344 RepID=A0ABX1CDA0_9ACTN|nr:hypothetical protein [Streptomyces bohaiensis]NJQ15187.1 hypothetical protein [Streptomyces bohaiensis]
MNGSGTHGSTGADAFDGPEDEGASSERPGEEARRRGRRRRLTVLGAVAAAWLAAGLAVVWLDWPVTAEADRPHAGGEWEPIQAAPLADRVGTGTVWAGDRLVVWGGRAPTGEAGAEPFTDGAVWSPSGEWSAMAEPPVDLVLAPGGFARWTGQEVLFGPVVDPGDDLDASSDGGLLAYDPAGDSWREVDLGGERLTAGGADDPAYAAVMTGGELILGHPAAVTVDDGAPGVVAVDPQDGALRHLAPGPYAPAGEQRDADADTDADADADADAGDQDTSDADADAGTDEGTDAGPVGEVRLVPAPDRVVAVVADGTETWVLALGSGEWRQTEPPPVTGDDRYVTVVAAGGRLLFLDETAPHAYDIAADQWRELEPPPGEAERHGLGHHFRWTGEAALAPGRAYHPADDTWTELPGPPLAEGEKLTDPYVSWSGAALVVFGGPRTVCQPEAERCEAPAATPETLAGWVYVG